MTKILILATLLGAAVFAQSYDTASASIAGAGTTCDASLNCRALRLPSGATTVAVQLSGTFNATVQFEVSIDGQTWSPISSNSTAVSSASLAGAWTFNVVGWPYFRVRGSAYTSGTVNATLAWSSGATVGNSLPITDDGSTLTVNGRNLTLPASATLTQGGVPYGTSGSPSPYSAALALSLSPAGACTNYVDGTNGLDTNNGTSLATAWQTLTKAESTATAASTICVADGTYTAAWTSSHTLSWYALHPGKVIQKPGSGSFGLVVTSTAAIFSGFVFDSSNAGAGGSYVVELTTGAASPTFINCTFQNGAAAQFASPTLAIANVTLINPTIITGASNSISTIYGQYTNLVIWGGTSTMTGSPHNWLRTAGTSNSISVYGHTISGAGITAGQPMIWLLGSTSENFTLQDSTINVSGTWTGLFQPGGAAGSGTMSLRHNNITYAKMGTIGAITNSTAGYVFRVIGNTITQTDATDIKAAVQLINSPGPIVQGNTITIAGSGDPIDVHSTGTAINTATIWNNVLTTQNTATGHGIVCGTDPDGGSGNNQITCDVEYNTIYGPRYISSATDNFATHGILIGYQHNHKVWYNSVLGEGIGIVIKHKGETVGGSAAFNVVAAPQTQQTLAQLYIKGSAGTQVVNNTVYSPYSTSAGSSTIPCMSAELNAAGQFSANDVFANNICYVANVGVLANNQSSVQATTPNNVWLNNAYYSTTGSFSTAAFVNSGSLVASFAAWQALNQDISGLYGADPLFNNAPGYDFSLKSGSPLIATGVMIPGITGPTPNIGAWQGAANNSYGVESVAFSATPVFSPSPNIRVSVVPLMTGNISSFTLAPGNDAQTRTLTFCQDATGSRTVAAPANVRGLGTVGSTASTCSSQTFVYLLGQNAWLATGAMVTNQ